MGRRDRLSSLRGRLAPANPPLMAKAIAVRSWSGRSAGYVGRLSCTMSLVLALGGCASAHSAPASGDDPGTATPSTDAPKGSDSSGSAGTSPASLANAPREEIWASFVADFNAHDPERLERWNAPSGMLLLDNSGAFVRVRHLAGASALHSLEGTYDGARVKTLTLPEALDTGPIPQVQCENTPEVKPGVYLGDGDGSYIQKFIDALQEYELAPPDEVTKIREVFAQNAGFERFMAADTKQSLKFLFGKKGGNIVLLAVDAVVPCSA